VAGRALAFSDPEIIRMATQNYVAVAGDDWYQRRRGDAEGEFFRKVADQGPRKGEGGSTRQGIYCLTADGQLLAYKNAGQAPEVMREVLRQGLAKWAQRPEEGRRPGGSKIGGSGPTDERYRRTPPPGCLIVNVYARMLDRDASGKLCDSDLRGEAGLKYGASQDHLWLTEEEWRSLVPADPKKGDTFPIPEGIVRRVVRFHLIDNTRGEPPMWRQEDVRSGKFAGMVVEVTADRVVIRVEGAALLATEAELAKAKRGYDVRLLGFLIYNIAKRTIERFDMLALGDHWGSGNYTRGARPGRTPLGIAFELAAGNSQADRVPPQAARDLSDYLTRVPNAPKP
jgi:hypothetical protein